MKKSSDLKNKFIDYVMIIIFHILALGGSIALFIFLSTGNLPTNIFLFDKVLARIKNTSTIKPQSQERLSFLFRKRGEVFVNNQGAVEGQELKKDETIVTKAKSFAIVRFGGEYQCNVRIDQNSKFNINEILQKNPDSKTENTTFNLTVGSVLSELENKKIVPVSVKIKTQRVVFGVRGTKFSILNDENITFLAVEHGIVEVENLITYKKQNIPAGSTYFADSEGLEKIISDPDFIKSFNWNFEGDASLSPDLLTIKQKIENENNKKKSSSNDIAPVDFLKLDEELKIFKANTELIEKDIEEEKKMISSRSQKIREEFPIVDDDIQCLENNPGRCNLHMESLLLSRGFPRTSGSPRLIHSIITDLKLYKKESEEKLKENKENVILWESLVEKRIKILEWAKTEKENLQKNSAHQPGVKEILEKLASREFEK